MSGFLGARVIPVLTITDASTAVPLARALADGGLTVLEITLRTEAALEAVRLIRAELPEIACGTGTLRTASDVEASLEAGAQFLVSPGSTDALLDAMSTAGLPSLPGAATPSEVLRLAERGCVQQKLFPAEVVGGPDLLRALAGPFPDIGFCATGRIHGGNAPSYLALPNVLAVGGSWMVPSAALAAGDWDAISLAAKEAAAL
jgi:2-dehydro-3-deoxyphosphogluconate aldolase / (4S)-4-hydroxy-2-oxoglutarate aldolase